MRKWMWILLAALIFLGGLGVLLYPTINGRMLERRSTAVAEEFLSVWGTEPYAAPEPTPMPYEELYRAMRQYNDTIYAEKQTGLCDPWAYEATSFDLTAYGIENGVIGVLMIPDLDLEMPIYLGASYDNMAAGAAHLSQTSLPIGGPNTNCVIAGHCNWQGAPYFQYLSTLEIGAELSVTNPWETMRYKVVETKIIDPNDVEKILIQDGRELLTLMTCHPYASGGLFRYLVFCERI